MTDTSPKHDHQEPGYSQQDWDEVSDSQELTEAEAAELRPAQEVPDVFALLPKRGRGRPKMADAKVNLTLRVDPALLEAYKATGTGWQVKMQEALAFFLMIDGMPKPQTERRTSGPVVTRTKTISGFKGVMAERTSMSGQYIEKGDGTNKQSRRPRPKSA